MNKKIFLVISSIAMFSMIATACGGQKNSNSSGEEPLSFLPATEGDTAFTDVTQFSDPIDTHTDAQKAFIGYEGKYEELTASQIQEITGQDSRGSKNLSAPNAIKIEFQQEPGENFDKYQVEFSMSGRFNEDTIKFTAKEGENFVNVYNLYAGTEYYYRVKALYKDSEDFDVSDTYTLETAEATPRNLYVDGMTNCRDLGGKKTVDGGYIKQGLIYRTAALDDSQSGSIATAEGKRVLLEDLKVKTEIELRGNTNGQGGEAKNDNASALDASINYKFIPFAYQSGKNLLFRNIEPVRKTFEVLGNPDNYPVFFHCRIGTDRTGLIALLVNSLIGLDLQSIYQDYLFSDFGCIGKVPTVGQANDDSIAGYVNQLLEFPGDSLQNSVYNFLLTAGIPAETLDNVINTLTVEDSVLGNDSSKVFVADVADMVATGTTIVNNDSLSYTEKIRAPKNTAKFTEAGNKLTMTFDSDADFTADLYANLTSRSTSGALNTAFKVTLDGTEQTLETTSFKTTDLGFGSQADYWIPAKLVSGISVPKGEGHVLEIEALTSTAINMAHFCFSGMSTGAKITL